MMGKLITREFALGLESPKHRFPWARNPWNVEHIPGGSSSGSGVALAAGMLHGATGSDTGGSHPGAGAFSGVTGLQPTHTRARRGRVRTLSWYRLHPAPN